MPEITWFGWIHTGLGIIALLSGFYTLVKYKVISLNTNSGKTYLFTTFLTAVSALAIFKHGGFGVAHALAVLTLLALLAGGIAEKTQLLGKLGSYAQALCYSATLLFHMVPAITDGLMRLPVHDPIVKNIEDPMLKGFYLAFLVAYLLGFIAQTMWLRKSNEVPA
jgi:uncharacterized membrane protein